MNDRHEVSAELLEKIVSRIEGATIDETIRKGPGEFVTNHEILGVVSEEHHELIDAVRSNNFHNVKEELMDIAVACIWGIASIENWIDRIGKTGREELERIS